MGFDRPNEELPRLAANPQELPASFSGLKASLDAVSATLEAVAAQFGVLGQSVEAFEHHDGSYTEAEYALYEAELGTAYEELAQRYDAYLAAHTRAMRTAADYTRHAAAEVFVRDVLASPVARVLLFPGPPGTGLLFGAPESATDLVQILNSLPVSMGGLEAGRDQLRKLAQAQTQLGESLTVLVDLAKSTVKVAETVQQAAEWTSAVGLTIASGGAAVAAWRAGLAAREVLKAAVPLIIGGIQTGAAAADTFADNLARRFPFLNADYIRWGARAVQLACVVYFGRAAWKAWRNPVVTPPPPQTPLYVDAGIEWTTNVRRIRQQGLPFEDYLERQAMPAGSRLPPNTVAFDFYDPIAGRAVSAKTLNTLTPSRTADPRRLYYQLKRYVDKTETFDGTFRLADGTVVRASQIASREIQLAIPSATGAGAMAEIERAMAYGASKGVPIIVTRAN